MMLLALDTALDDCAAALLVREGDAVTVVSEVETIGRGHAERLMSTVERLMTRAGATLAAVDAFAVTVGPGSFTGIRVGVAAARGFALAAR
ncbi:MAG: tRNA (adenosine(37)-N6)-threonylcarbamoyltransferase complex dimerization subunit type 1 TsaB, partial [Siculibacillus sp.]